MNNKYQRLLLTGATGGIGESLAKALDQDGYCLLLTGRNEDKLQTLHNKLAGNRHQHFVADLTTPEGIVALKTAAEEFGISGVINCLGTNKLATLSDIESEDISRMVSANLLAPINICKALIPILASQPEGVIVNVGSIFGSIGYAGSSIYCASKFALRGFTESLRRELSDTNVRIIYFAPRATNTSLNTDAVNQMNRELGNAVDEPERVAKQVVKVLNKGKSANCYLGWPERMFVKLNSLFPGVVDKALEKQLATIKRYCNAK